MHKKKIKVNPVDQVLQVLIYLIIIALCLIILLPCLNVVALAFNDGADAARGGVWFWPREFTLDNFKEVFKDGSITSAYVVTIARTVIGTFLSLMVTTMGRLRTETGRPAGKKNHHHADHLYHVVRRRYDSYLYSVQKPASSELFLGLCGAESGKRYLSSDGTDLL